MMLQLKDMILLSFIYDVTCNEVGGNTTPDLTRKSEGKLDGKDGINLERLIILIC